MYAQSLYFVRNIEERQKKGKEVRNESDYVWTANKGWVSVILEPLSSVE